MFLPPAKACPRVITGAQFWNYRTIAEKMISGIFLNPGLLAKSAQDSDGNSFLVCRPRTTSSDICPAKKRKVRKSDRVNFALWEATTKHKQIDMCANTPRRTNRGAARTCPKNGRKAIHTFSFPQFKFYFPSTRRGNDRNAVHGRQGVECFAMPAKCARCLLFVV